MSITNTANGTSSSSTKTSMMPANSILILDDEADIVAVFKKSLELAGYSSVFGFTNPLLALEHFKANNSANYALIITDIRMPAMNGIEFVKEIRKLDKDIAIIVMSAFDLKELAIDEEQESLKIAELLNKPIMVSQLKAIVSKYMPNSKSSGDIQEPVISPQGTEHKITSSMPE